MSLLTPKLLSSARLTKTFALVLVILGSAYLTKGLTHFLANQGQVSDLKHRVNGLERVFSGQSPYGTTPDRGPAAPDAPWGWLGNALIYWPPARIRPWYYATLALAGLTTILLGAWRIGRTANVEPELLLPAAAFAVSSTCTALGLGQNSIFVFAALMGCLLTAQEGHELSSGILLGAAMVKPQIAGMFVFPFIFQLRLLPLAAAAGFGLLATMALGVLIGMSPFALILEWQRYLSGIHEWPGFGPLSMLVGVGLPTRTALLVTALVFGGIGAGLIFWWRKAETLVLFAIAAVAGRLGSYHQLYDNGMLLFLLLALGVNAARKQDRLGVVGFLVVGVSLWAPGRFCDWTMFQVFQILAWLFGLIVLLRGQRRNPSSKKECETDIAAPVTPVAQQQVNLPSRTEVPSL
jgi:hypothetical protein